MSSARLRSTWTERLSSFPSSLSILFLGSRKSQWSYFKINRDNRADTCSFLTQGPSHLLPSKRTSFKPRATFPWLPGALLAADCQIQRQSWTQHNLLLSRWSWNWRFCKCRLRGHMLSLKSKASPSFSPVWRIKDLLYEKEKSAWMSHHQKRRACHGQFQYHAMVVLPPVPSQRSQKASCPCAVFLPLKVSKNSNRKSWLMLVVWTVKLTQESIYSSYYLEAPEKESQSPAIPISLPITVGQPHDFPAVAFLNFKMI